MVARSSSPPPPSAHSMFTAWTPRDKASFADDEWSDHNPSPIHPMYNDSPGDAWLSPSNAAVDDTLFDYTLSNSFCSLLDDSAAHHEQQSMLQRWRTPAFPGKPTAKANALSRQSTVDDVVIASEWEEKITRRYQRKHKLHSMSLGEVKRTMPPIEFDPAFADSDTEDEDEPAFNPDTLADPPMRVRTPRLPSPIDIPAASFASPLTPLSDPHPVSVSPPPTPALVPPVAVDPVVKQEPEESRLTPVKRTHEHVDPDHEAPADDVVSEGDYVPSDDEEDDADPTYGAPKARRPSHPTHSRTHSTDKPVRLGPGRRRRLVEDTAPSQCTYESPINGQRCQQIFARLPEMKRHIDHYHHEQEARAVIEGRLDRLRATLLGDTWDGTLGKPTCEGCGTEFSRRDAVKRHQNEVKARFEDGRCVWCPGTQGRKGSAKRVAAAKLAAGTPIKKQRRK